MKYSNSDAYRLYHIFTAPCEPGFYWPRTTPYPSCTPCPIGYYKYQSDDSECIECPGVRTTFAEGTISRDDCFGKNHLYVKTII